MKCIQRNEVTHWWRLNGDKIPLEIVMLDKCRNVEGIIQFLEYFERPAGYLIVMERPEAVIDLFDYITERGSLDELLARDLFRQVVGSALGCRNVGVVHGDIKSENLLLNLDTGCLKLIDFCNADFIQDVYEKFGGTRLYAPPEWILRCSYCLYTFI